MAAADLKAIRTAIKGIVDNLSNMGQVYDYEPTSIAGGKAAIIGAPEPFSLVSSSYGKGLLDIPIPVTLIAGEITERTAYQTLDGWVLSSAGIWQAFLADRTLGGLVDDCIATEVRTIGERPVGDTVRLAAEVVVRVLVRRDA